MTTDEERLKAIRTRLTGVTHDARDVWAYEPKHEMFVGATNALMTRHGMIDLGRTPAEYIPYLDGGKTRYRLADWCGRERERIEALGKFLESCREDIDYLLARLEPRDTDNAAGI